MAYSMVNHFVMMFCVALPYDSFAWTQATSGPNRPSATAARRS